MLVNPIKWQRNSMMNTTYTRQLIRLTLLVILVLACICKSATIATAQSIKQMHKQADDAFFKQQYGTAAELYEKVVEHKPTNVKLNYRLGFSYLNNKQPDKAIKPLLFVYKNSSKFTPELFFMLGQAHHLTHKFDSATTFYRLFRSSLKIDDYDAVDAIEKNLEECRNGKILMNRPIAVELENLGSAVNSPFSDFVPVISQDEKVLAFTSRRPTNVGGKNAPDGEPFEDIYIAKTSEDTWEPAKNIGVPVNTDRHDACVAISPDGNTIYLYRDTNGGDIYYSQRRGTSWSVPVSMGPAINSPHYEPSLSVSDDGQYVFFSSNRPGGNGGLDIYISQKQPNGTWGEALNLGPIINSKYDEDAPFLQSATNTLFFSSRGHNTMGGYDIFRSTLGPLAWMPPINLGFPVNSAFDDLHFNVPANGLHAYYATTRPDGLGKKDIYKMIFPVPVSSDSMLLATSSLDPNRTPVQKITLTGTVREAGSNNPIETLVTFVDFSEKLRVLKIKSDAKGHFKTNLIAGHEYSATINLPGYLFYSSTINLPKTGTKQLEHTFELYKIAAGATSVLQNVYFETGKAEVKPSTYLELDRLAEWLTANPKIKIEVAGFTDNVGQPALNLTLSQDRATAVVEFLVNKGVDANRLIAKGYGEQNPIADNSSEEGRKRNRRTEFKILEN